MSRTSAGELSEAIDLEFYLERESLAYKTSRGRSGEQLNVRACPLCADEKSKVYLNAESGVGNCFACGEKFSKLGFIHAYLGHTEAQWALTFRHVEEALKDQGWRPRRTVAVCVDETAIEIPISISLPTSEGETLVYLRDRGIDDELTRYFGLRYCEDAWWNYVKDDGSRGGQHFGGRVIIPVYDLDGALVTFQGRDITGTAERKYLFPSGLPGTGRFLYNGQNACGARRAVMGEGSFDVFGLQIACNSVQDLRDVIPLGSFGKSLSYGDSTGNDQLGRFLKLKHQGLEEVIICWDGTADALQAAVDAAKLLDGIGLKARIALMPAGKDPNEVGAEVTVAALRGAALYTPTLAIEWRLRNPFKVPAQRKSIFSACP